MGTIGGSLTYRLKKPATSTRGVPVPAGTLVHWECGGRGKSHIFKVRGQEVTIEVPAAEFDDTVELEQEMMFGRM